MAFRGRLAAAPLTPDANKNALTVIDFPRPSGRGPIDARYDEFSGTIRRPFRGRLAAAPLTRAGRAARRGALPLFAAVWPRPH